MAITPTTIGRVSFNQRALSLLNSITRINRDLFDTQNRLSSGKRLLSLSDSPADASAAIILDRDLDRQELLTANLRHAGNFVSATDTAMNEISSQITEAHSLALANIDSFVSQSERDAAATVIDSIIRELVTVGNRQYLDVELFAGHEIGVSPFGEINGGVRYSGDTSSLNVRIDTLQEVAFNLHGDGLYGALSSEIVGSADLSPGLTATTRLSALNGATDLGIRNGTIQIVDGGTPYLVDLTAAHTVQDVIDVISDQTGGNVTAAINGPALDLTGTGNLTVSDVGGGTMASDLGILQAVAAPTVSGLDTDPRLTATTPLSAFSNGTGLALTTLSITNGSLSATVDLSAANTVEDILNALNNAGVAVRARINDAGTGIDVLNTLSGSDLRISETGGTTATDLGIRSYNGGTLLSSLNRGQGVNIVAGKDDLLITDSNGTEYKVNLDGATTVQEVIDKINAVTGAALTASQAVNGNGIRLVEAAPGAGQLTVTRPDIADSHSFAADDLGFGSQSTVVANGEIVSADVNGIQPTGVFSVLIRLRNALRAGDTNEISAAANELDAVQMNLNESRGIVGTLSQSLTRRLDQTETNILETQARLSEKVDLDYAEAITQFTQIQTAYQASLSTGSRLLSLSFLDFLR